MSREDKTRPVQFKILHKTYWTLSKLFSAKLLTESTVRMTTLEHFLWSCPRDYWTAFEGNITLIFGAQSSNLGADWIHTSFMLGRKLVSGSHLICPQVMCGSVSWRLWQQMRTCLLVSDKTTRPHIFDQFKVAVNQITKIQSIQSNPRGFGCSLLL